MATNKHALIRYQALDHCFASRGKRYFWEDLLEACNAALAEYSSSTKGIGRRQLFEDIKHMESDQGWSIPLDRHQEDKRIWYRYSDPDFSINKRPLNVDEAGQLKEALLTLNRFKGMPQFQWVDELVARLETGFGLRHGAERIIEFEENPYLKGNEHITTLFHAILSEQVLTVTYQGFKQAAPGKSKFHPHYLKQYNNRWFVFGVTEGYEGITNLALDRLERIEQAKGRFRRNTNVDYAEHFEDVVGVSVHPGPAKAVEILVAAKLWPYLASKPLHGSQKVITRNEAGVTIQIEVIPNHELQALLLSYGEDLQVLAPEDLRQVMRERAEALARSYGV